MMALGKKLDVEYRLIEGDCIDVMGEMDECSIDSIVTDPPYGLLFMGKKWDHAVPGVEYWTECLRVLKPGGNMVAFGGTRLYHRLTCAIEDAGFEIKDCLMWIHGSGMPKSHNVGKAIDKAAGVERKKLGTVETAPVTPEAIKWEGWGTSIKPAYEPIVLAYKPFKGTVVKNVLKHGTGALNINGCRVYSREGISERSDFTESKGRWPANVILSHHPECEFLGYKKVKAISGGNNPVRKGGVHAEEKGHQTPDREQTYCQYGDDNGEETVEDWKCHSDCPMTMFPYTKSGSMKSHHICRESENNCMSGKNYNRVGRIIQGDQGSAARFFYCARASKSERGKNNKHPTVKPLALMKWLCRLITPPGGIVLDPFCGSGSTLVAAIEEGFEAVGIDFNEKYVKISEDRISNIKPIQTDFFSTKNLLKMMDDIDF